MVKCCTTSCGIAATLIAGMAYCTYMGNRSQLVNDYMRTLTPELGRQMGAATGWW